ncbi:MAG: YqeG family HAD IIIA-type phosphatase [Coriobacteriia bacterium]
MSLAPDFYYRSVRDIDLDELKRRGIETLLVDLDNTLLPRDTNVVPSEIREWAAEVERKGFRICLISNNWHERVFSVAQSLGCELVSKAIKPLPPAFLLGLRRTGSKRRHAAVVGDQLFTDMLGGKLLGMTTVMVLPLSKTDLPHTLFLRKIERRVLQGRQPQP